jgi:hypothetical protein
MRVLSRLGAVRVMTTGAVDNGIAVVNDVIGYVTHGSSRSCRIVTGLAHGLLFPIAGGNVAHVQSVTIITDNLVAFVVWGHQGDGRADRQNNRR